MAKVSIMRSRIRNAAVAAAALLMTLSVAASQAATLLPPPVAGGPAGAGPCAAQATTARAARPINAVAALRAFGDCEIGRRQKTLASLAAFVNGSKGVTAADRAALTGQIASDAAGLGALKTAIDGQARLATLKLEIAQIAANYRVYLLVAPKVNLVNAADDVVALQPGFSRIATNLAARVAAAAAAGKDVAAAQTALTAMNSEVAAAVSLAAPIPGRLLPVTAAQSRAGIAGPILVQARAALLSARDHLKNAVGDGRAVVAALQ
jgi:hypothetical protein